MRRETVMEMLRGLNVQLDQHGRGERVRAAPTVKCPTCQEEFSYERGDPRRGRVEDRCSHNARLVYVKGNCSICIDVAESPVVSLACGHVVCKGHFQDLNGRLGSEAMKTREEVIQSLPPPEHNLFVRRVFENLAPDELPSQQIPDMVDPVEFFGQFMRNMQGDMVYNPYDDSEESVEDYDDNESRESEGEDSVPVLIGPDGQPMEDDEDSDDQMNDDDDVPPPFRAGGAVYNSDDDDSIPPLVQRGDISDSSEESSA